MCNVRLSYGSLFGKLAENGYMAFSSMCLGMGRCASFGEHVLGLVFLCVCAFYENVDLAGDFRH